MTSRSDNLTNLRTQLLSRNGIAPIPEIANKVRPPPKRGKRYSGKTLVMRSIELQYGRSMEELIAGEFHSKYIAQMLGVSVSCISRWRKRLGIKSLRGQVSGTYRGELAGD